MTQNSNSDANNVPSPSFSQEIMERLFYWTRDKIFRITRQNANEKDPPLGEIGETRVLGAFVSFKKRGRLRSCMGYMREGDSLVVALSSAAYSATLNDPRFPPVSSDELYDLDLEIWALGSLRRVEERGEARRDVVRIGRDGLQIQGRGRRGLLLPSVPVELNWDIDQFLNGLCDKAGLARGAWKDDDVELFSFEGTSFKRPFVWNVSANPELARFIERRNRIDSSDNTERSTQRAVFSLAPGLLQWTAPSTRATQPRTIDYAQSTRESAVAGMFYPRSKAEQDATLDSFDEENGRELDSPLTKRAYSGALIPHAGWIYSGRLAAKTLMRIQAPETVVVIAPKHRREGANFAICPYGQWDFKGGCVSNDLDFSAALARALPPFQLDATAHRSEHAIEVQLPLLSRYFPESKVVGLLIGASTKRELDELGRSFADFITRRANLGRSKPLLLISSDMSHYVTEETARALDEKALDALETTDPGRLYDVVRENQITMCGILPAFFALTALKKNDDFHRAVRVGRTTSGAASGDYERVVGYAGYLFE